MKPLKVVLCSYSFGLGNGIAHMDSSLTAGIDESTFSLKVFVLRPDFPLGHVEAIGKATHISLADAFTVLCEELADADILQVNGAFDPVASNAASVAGVPAIIEVMHQVECGGMHAGIDAVVCVSELVRSIQNHSRTIIIHNGIDTELFSFKPGRRHEDSITIVQVANSAKVLHCELAEIAQKLNNPSIRPVMVGDRAPVLGVPSLGLVSDMPAVYHESDLLFLIERRYAFGLVFIEGMACGTLPVVSADSGAIEFVHHGKTGWVVNPASPSHACRILEEATETVGSPKFTEMQINARALVEQQFSQERMLHDYQKLWTTLGCRHRKKPVKSAVWMNLTLFALLFRNGNEYAVRALEEYLADVRPLEPYFLRHPMGQVTLSYLLQGIAPKMLELGAASLLSRLCSKLRHSRCASPLLDHFETTAKEYMARRKSPANLI